MSVAMGFLSILGFLAVCSDAPYYIEKSEAFYYVTISRQLAISKINAK